jgi:zinc/manganese transport system substrate-binding protein
VARTILACLGIGLLATSCGSSGGDGRVHVVASTNVYGDIVRQIGGAHVSVTSVLSDPNADPHLFEPRSSTGLAVARSSVVVQNGVGYDTFMTKLEAAAPSRKRVVVTIADALRVHGRGANPHLWYDVSALDTIARVIARALTQADAAHRRAYAVGRRRFVIAVEPLQSAVRALRAQHGGAPVASTEPVPGYLLEDAGLRDLAPRSFTRPIEEGTEPSASAVSAMTRLVAERRVRVLLYNKQAVSPITARIRAAAARGGVRVVAITETLPPGLSFQAWQLRQIHALADALR